MTSTLELVRHYQRNIDRAMENDHRLLHCIEKLNKLNVTVDHLQETGIGRTINNLRKNDGEVGYAARALVTKWKTMVAVEENQKDSADDVGPEMANDSANVEDNEDDDEDGENFDDEEDNRLHIDETENIEPESEKFIDTEVSDNRSSKHSRSKHGDKHRHRSDHKSDKKRTHKDYENKSSHRGHHRDKDEKCDDVHTDKRSDRHEVKCDDRHDEKHGHNKQKSSQIKNKEVSSRSSSNNDSDEKETKHKSSTSKSSKTEKSQKQNEGDTSYSSQKSDKISKHHSHSENEKTNRSTNISDKKSRNKPEASHNTKESKTLKEKDKSRSSSKDTQQNKNECDKTSTKKRKKESADQIHIDSTMGASFAEALGMLDIPTSSKAIKKPHKEERPSTSTDSKTSNAESGSSNNKKSSSKRIADDAPVLLSKRHKLEPLPDIASEIPPATVTISNNYKPMPLNPTVMECVFQNSQGKFKQMTDEEAIGFSIQSKTMKTKVFSGNKVGFNGVVPSLFDMCIHILQDNIDFLEFTGGVPFDILKPVIERATVEQLMTLEDYNPYLIEDTDCLWEQHCKRRFRGKQPEELESWREMFLRCLDEEQAKFKSLTENIKLARQKSIPVRTTKLAYVDSYVKPPRNVVKKQVKYGTDTLATVSPAARVESLNGTGGNIAKLGDTRLKVAAAIRESIPTHAPRPNPNRKAPLMQKTLMSMKKVFRR